MACLLLAWTAGPRSALADLGDASSGRASSPEEEDFSGSPYGDYGQFNNQEAEEEEGTRFFQYGRFFGIGVGLGYQPLLGNRGLLWNGGFPTIEFKLHYWFDFNFALALDVYSSTHFYDSPDASIGHVDVSFIHVGLELKYYFDTKNLASTISFANPYILAGVGPYTKTETSTLVNAPSTDTAIGLSAGAGFEFAINPRKVYLQVESRIHLMNFKDNYTQAYAASGVPDLTGQFITLVGHIMFTW